MINLKTYKGICFHPKDDSKEKQQLLAYCNAKDIPYSINKICPKKYIPIGSIDWVLKQYGQNIKPDYYPEFCRNYLFRDIWITDIWPLNDACFIQPGSKYKRFTGFIHKAGSYKGKKRNEAFVCSKIVNFVNEWRYYISNGKILSGEWYWGDEINTPNAPELKIKIPEFWCGTLDFGLTDNNQFALVEAHHPFSCGYYGKNWELYLQWLIDGWVFLEKIK
jgi:hypothetical protein